MHIVLFDEECNLCNLSIYWISYKDLKKKFFFASLQSSYGKKFLTSRELELHNFKTLVLYIPKKAYYTKSTAILKIIAEFGLLYKIISYCLLFIPQFIRDFFYQIIASNRHKFFKVKKINKYFLDDYKLNQRFIK